MTDTHATAAPGTAQDPHSTPAQHAASPAHGPRRRSVVAATAASTALLPLAGGVPAAQAAQRPAQGGGPDAVFAHGIASGDPLPDGVLLWTRVTPSPEALPGSGRGADTEVRWEVAADSGFREIVAHGSHTATADSDHTVKADVRGLRPATAYWFRFSAAGERSPVGRTRTAPADDAELSSLRFGVVSCSNYDGGYFAAYRHLAARRDLDAVLHLGDYIYEYENGRFPEADEAVRCSEPSHEIVTLADYRLRHATYKTDPDLRAVHAAHPMIAIWDDHEVADNSWREGAGNHTEGAEGHFADRLRAAKQAYFEWLPVRTSVAGTVYRRLRFGKLADLFLLDLRSFRNKQPKMADGRAIDDPDRTMTGRRQLDWLKSGLSRSRSAWRMVGTSVMISPVGFGAVPRHLMGPIGDMLGIPKAGLAINVDQWDGYTADRRDLLSHLREHEIDNTVFLSGDIHMAWACDVPVESAEYPWRPPVATEFVVTSITSDNVDDFLKVPPHTTSLTAAAAVRADNRHVRWVDMDSHGYGVLELTQEQAQMDFYVLSDRKDRNATATVARSYRTRSGSQRVERAEQPVR